MPQRKHPLKITTGWLCCAAAVFFSSRSFVVATAIIQLLPKPKMTDWMRVKPWKRKAKEKNCYTWFGIDGKQREREREKNLTSHLISCGFGLVRLVCSTQWFGTWVNNAAVLRVVRARAIGSAPFVGRQITFYGHSVHTTCQRKTYKKNSSLLIVFATILRGAATAKDLLVILT